VQFKVTFYQAKDGTKPMTTLLDDVRAKQPVLHNLLVAGLRKLKQSERHGPPLTELVDSQEGIFELRVGRTDIARAFFFFRRGREIIVTNGYVKKSQKVNPRELNRARDYKRDWEARHP
jgi:phage-related protein